MWRTIQMTDIRILRHEPSTLSKLCRYAVDQSCGRLEDIYIKYFGTDDLLKYVADRYRCAYSILLNNFLCCNHWI
jgi:hypothetical protein